MGGPGPSLDIAGDGFYFAIVDLTPAPHARVDRYGDELEDLRGAVTIDGADLVGSLQAGRGLFELNSYAPPGVVEADGDRCILASIEFHSVQLTSARGGTLYLSGFLGAAEAYRQDVFDRIATGTSLGDIEDLAGDDGPVRYRPPAYVPLQGYLGWEASIRLVPRTGNR